MKIIRIGVMGCATIAERSVIPAIMALPNYYKLVAIASRTKEKANKFANKFNCEAVTGYDVLIARDDIDAIYMPLPTGLHLEWIIKTLEAGKHIYAEKSIADNFMSAKQMIDLATKKKLALMEGYMFQYHLQHQKIFKLLQEDVIGDIRHFSASFGFPPLSENNFRYDKKIGGGALLDCAGYVVRAAFFVLKQKLEVKAASIYYNPRSNSSIYGSAFMRGEKGIGASLSFGFDNYYQCNYVIWGSKGKITVQRAFTPKPMEETYLILETIEGSQQITMESDNHFMKAFIEFYKTITDGGMDRHYSEILEQSEALDEVAYYSIN